MRVPQSLMVLLLGFALFACAGNPRGASSNEPATELPKASELYTTELRPDGVLGGERAKELARSIEATLRDRGDEPEADGALAALAAWTIAEAQAGRAPDTASTDLVVRRLGYAGVVYAVGAYSLENGDSGFRELVGAIAGNLRINRYGVFTVGDGPEAAIALGAMEIQLQPFPRKLSPGGRLKLAGEIADRFKQARVYLTTASGDIEESVMPARKLDVTLQFPKAGIYKVEVMGDGPSGPVVLANVPVYVGVAEPRSVRVVDTEGAERSAEESERRMLELLNEARKKVGAPTLGFDEELRAVALAHSDDMAQNHFFGHVSPTTGTPDDRFRKAALLGSKFGENVARGPNADAAHQLLMESPGHRANMLRRDFTHVGIGVARSSINGQPELFATLVFARRPSANEAAHTASSVAAAIAEFRKSKKLKAAKQDPVLQAAAEAGIQSFKQTSPEAKQAALAESGRALQARSKKRRKACAVLLEALELAQLADYPALLDPYLEYFGVGLVVRPDAAGTTKLHILLMLEASAKSEIGCQ
jgi:uncharacterized protein YkwD